MSGPVKHYKTAWIPDIFLQTDKAEKFRDDRFATYFLTGCGVAVIGWLTIEAYNRQQ